MENKIIPNEASVLLESAIRRGYVKREFPGTDTITPKQGITAAPMSIGNNPDLVQSTRSPIKPESNTISHHPLMRVVR